MVKTGLIMTSALANAIKKVATGPHLSKNLSQQEAYQATLEILNNEADPVRAAVFFIAMRMKRETNEENLGILEAMQDVTVQSTVSVDQCLIFADPFNGFNRHCPVAVFLPAVLAAAGLPTLSQGVFEMGPKFGVTHAQVLKLAGYSHQQTSEAAASAISDANIGWAYLDQSQASSGLYALQHIRTQMIKRPSLATLEKMLMPVKAQQKTHLAIGFVHKEYPPILGWLAQAFGYDSAMIVRGLEGGIIPTLRESSNNHRQINDGLMACPLDPKEFGIEQTTRGVMSDDDKVTAKRTLELGLHALSGERGATYDSLVYGAAIMLWHTGLSTTPQQAASKVREVLDNGAAKVCFEAGINA